MPDRDSISRLVERALAAVRDPALVALVRDLLVEPCPVERDWDYGAAGQKFVCWTVLERPPSGTGVAYCEEGFGPAHPWGLVVLGGPHTSMGMDSAWYASLEDAVRESRAWDGENPAGFELS